MVSPIWSIYIYICIYKNIYIYNIYIYILHISMILSLSLSLSKCKLTYQVWSSPINLTNWFGIWKKETSLGSWDESWKNNFMSWLTWRTGDGNSFRPPTSVMKLQHRSDRLDDKTNPNWSEFTDQKPDRLLNSLTSWQPIILSSLFKMRSEQQTTFGAQHYRIHEVRGRAVYISVYYVDWVGVRESSTWQVSVVNFH